MSRENILMLTDKAVEQMELLMKHLKTMSDLLERRMVEQALSEGRTVVLLPSRSGS